jgi:hypothetical protein
MAKNETKRISPSIVRRDREIYAAVKGMKGYAPANPDYALEKLDDEHDALTLREQAAVQKEAEAAAARDAVIGGQWSFHNRMLGVKAQVVAQFGPNSDEAQAIGLKKKTEYKTRTRKASKKNGGQ